MHAPLVRRRLHPEPTKLTLAARPLARGALGYVFGCATESEAQAAALRAMRVPFSVTFVIANGVRFAPGIASELGAVCCLAWRSGDARGPV
jgi:hypothetical protein